MRRAALGLVTLLSAGLIHAHPLGNNTVNRAAVIEVTREQLSIRYLLDLAEIPTLLAAQEADVDGDGSTTDTEWEAYARRRSDDARAGIELSVNGRPISLALRTASWQRLPGAAGLGTLRLEAFFGVPLRGDKMMRIDYRDGRRPDEAGWKEVVATAGRGLLVQADVPTTSPSRHLMDYPPAEAGVSDVLAARIEVRAVPPQPRAASANLPVSLRNATPKASPAMAPAQAPADITIPAVAGQPGSGSVDASSAESVTQAASSVVSQAGGFFRLGVHHIATGWDHLVFLLGLIVAQQSLRRLAGVITAFTLAHSLTLGLAASGLVTPPGDWVEPAIALTIAYVGLANLVGRLRHGAAVAFAFGLVHGFGFAGALAESLEGTQIGGSGWLFHLAAFNIGIEAFQLGLILVLLPLIHLGARFSWSGAAHNAVSLGVMGAGLGWFFVRI